MEVKDVMSLIRDIREEPGRTEKTRLLEILGKDELGAFVLKWTYDPMITYGIKPGRTENQSSFRVKFRPSLVEGLLYRLSRRELTGREAEMEVAKIMMELDDQSGELLYMILNRDLKMGVGANSVYKLFPDLIKVMRVMRAETFEPRRVKQWPMVIEPKLDGHRCTFVCREGMGGFFTRAGHRMPAFDHLVEPLLEQIEYVLEGTVPAHLRGILQSKPGRVGLNFVIDGEAMTESDSFNETSGALRRQSEQAENGSLHVYDFMRLDEFEAEGPVERSYLERREQAETLVQLLRMDNVSATPRYFVRNEDEANTMYQAFLDDGYEGAMLKDPSGFYHKKKNAGWLKMKPEDTEDLPIVGFFNGDRDSKNEHGTGGIIVDRAGVEVRVSGISDAMRAMIWELWKHDAKSLGIDPIVGFKPGFSLSTGATTADKVDFKLLGRLVEVEYNEVTEDGSLRHPRFVKFRDDKTEPTVLGADDLEEEVA